MSGPGSNWQYPMLYRKNGSLGGGANTKFASFPIGTSLASRAYTRSFPVATLPEQDEWFADPGTPAAGDGDTWRSTDYGTITYTLVNSSAPAYLRMATAATDNNGGQFQAVGGASHSATVFDASALRRFYIEGIFRLSDANNDADTLEQCEFFFGFAPIDTDVFATIEDFVGLHKDDGEGSLYGVSSDGSVATIGAAPVRTESIKLSNSSADDDGTRLINEWFQIGFQIDLIGTNQGLMFPWLRSGSTNYPEDQMKAPIDLGTEIPDAAMVPTIAFDTGEAVAKNLDIALVHYGFEYKLG